jgi:hypothetical protein|tara:strand:+ start:5704 stop:6561 length:858 start_codon:yes stop_codon:yes gene_type:complete
MPTNVFFNHAVSTEQHLYEDIVVESLRMYGHECFYLPREVVEEDTILNEDVQSAFGDAYAVEMYIENTDGFEGEGDLMSKFGLSIRDTATFVISLRSWERFISLDSNLATSLRPNEGDLIHFPMSGSLFEIKFVEHENPFYQVGKLFTFKMQCELFEYSGEDFDTDVAGIDKIEDEDAYNIEMTMVAGGSGDYNVGENLTKSSVVVGEVLSWVGGNTRTLKVKDVTTTLVVGDVLVGAVTTAQYTVNSITDVLTMSNDALAQNLEFEATDSTYLDFSETNPFGEP